MRARPTLEIAARPSPVSCSTDRTAVVVVDMQNDFASPGGMFARAGVDVRAIQAIVPPMAALLDAARAAGVVVVYLKMGFRPDLGDAGAPDSPTWVKHLPFEVGLEVTAPDGTPSRILVRDTWNTDIVDELAPRDGDLVVDKNRYSGFYGTELDDLLRAREVETLVVVGATTSVCVESTVRDATFRDYRCLVVEDCVAEPIGADALRTNQDASLLVLERLFAWVTDSPAVTEALLAAPAPAAGQHRRT
jgi:ureidoacrylate peracid hydrolase